jgi:serine/threonine protein kinase
MGKNPWTEAQYSALCYILIRNVFELHKQKIAHRDIRPHNFVFNINKKGFVLGGLQHSVLI